jgi:hypothetical protein
MGQGRGEGGLAETIAPKRLRGIAEKVGSAADVFVDRPQQEDELLVTTRGSYVRGGKRWYMLP